MHQPLSSISNMGRSGTQIVYGGNWKRLLQDEGHHEENSVKDIENFNKVVETLIKKNSVYKLLDPRKHLLKQYKDPLDSLTEDRRKRKSSTFFLWTSKLQTFSSRILHQKRSSRYLKPKAKKKIWSGSFLSCNQKSEKKKKKSSVNSELTFRKMDQPGKALRRKFSSTTTASKGPHDYWKSPEWSHQWRSL